MLQIVLGVHLGDLEGQIFRAMQCTPLGTFKLAMKIVRTQLLEVVRRSDGMVKFLNRMIVLVY